MIHRIPKTKVRGALTLAEIRDKSQAELDELRRNGWLLPIAGADGADDDDDDDSSKKSKGKSGKSDDDDDGDDDGEKIEVSKREYDGMQSTIGALRRSVKKLEAAAENADDEKAKEAGKFEDLYEKEKAKGADLSKQIQGLEKGGTVRDVAARLNFHNPERALKFVDLDEIDNEADAERALKALAKSDPYLVSTKKRTSGKVGDDDQATGGDDNSGENAGGESKAKASGDNRTPQQKMASAFESNSGGSQQE